MLTISFIVIDTESGLFKKNILEARKFMNTVRLDTNLTYDVAIDQSTSCSGIAIRSIDNSSIMVMELYDSETLYSSNYVTGLKAILNTLLPSLSIRYLILEEPLPYISENQNKKLVALKKDLIKFFDSSLIKSEHFLLMKPQSWRAGLIKKDNPHGRRSKMSTVHEVMNKYPLMRNFLQITRNPSNDGGYDGFESLGILLGTLSRYSVKNDTKVVKVLGPKNTIKVGVGIFIPVCNDDIKPVAEVCNFVCSLCNTQETPKVKIYNDEEGIYNNVKMSLTDNLTLCEVTEELDRLSIFIKYNIPFDYQYGLYMLVVPLSYLTENKYECLKDNNFYIDKFY